MVVAFDVVFTHTSGSAHVTTAIDLLLIEKKKGAKWKKPGPDRKGDTWGRNNFVNTHLRTTKPRARKVHMVLVTSSRLRLLVYPVCNGHGRFIPCHTNLRVPTTFVFSSKGPLVLQYISVIMEALEKENTDKIITTSMNSTT